jgi:hypothetical protein
MMKAAGVFAFVAALVFGIVAEAPAVAFNSTAGQPGSSCAAGAVTFPLPGTCAGGFVAITPNGSWQPNNPAGSTAVWVSYTNTGSGGSVVTPNALPPLTTANATEIFRVNIPAGFSLLTLTVWADDTAGVRLFGDAPGTFRTPTNAALAPNPTQGPVCAAAALSCFTGGAGLFSIPLTGAAGQILEFDVFQRGADTFGLLYVGDLTPVPEPATMLLLGSALAGVGFLSRRRWAK